MRGPGGVSPADEGGKGLHLQRSAHDEQQVNFLKVLLKERMSLRGGHLSTPPPPKIQAVGAIQGPPNPTHRLQEGKEARGEALPKKHNVWGRGVAGENSRVKTPPPPDSH